MRRVSRRSLLGQVTAAAAACLTARTPLVATTQATDKNLSHNTQTPNDSPLTIPAWYYQHFDGNDDAPIPESGFGGWKKTDLNFSRDHTAVVVMHAWDMGTQEQFPGWWRAVPYAKRANAILRDVFPPLLKAVRDAKLPLFHVAGGGDYYKKLPGYQRAVDLAGPAPAGLPRVKSDPRRDKLHAFRKANVFPGGHNKPDIDRGFARLDFPEQARPQGTEGVAENGHQLFGLCKDHGVNHLIYCGFAINWCLLMSPGGMMEMQKYGLMCSAIRQATTAVENKESAPGELCKEIALWRVALAFGFVFDADDLMGALRA